MSKVSDKRKTGRTRKFDSTRGSAKNAVKEPENALKDFTSHESAHDDGGKGNSSERIDNARLSDAIDDVEGLLSLSTSCGEVKGGKVKGAHVGEYE